MNFILQFGVDILFVLILIISVIVSMRKGLLKSMLSLVSIILALVVAAAVNEPIATSVYDDFIAESVVQKIDDGINESIESFDIQTRVESVVGSVPEFITAQLSRIGFDINETVEEITGADIPSHAIAEEISTKIIRPGAIMLLRLLVFLIVFLVVWLLLVLLSKLISKFADIPVLKEVNKWLGALLGLVKGVMTVFSLGVALNFISQLLKNTDAFAQAIENSLICGIIETIVK